MEHAKIVQKVRDILNEHGEVDAVSIGTDRVQLEDYINAAIPDAVIMLAQKGYRVNVVSFSNKNGLGDMVPEDLAFENFISLICAHSISWKKEVTKLTDINSPEYKMSQNPYTSPSFNNPIGYSYDGKQLTFLPDLDAQEVPVIISGLYNAKYDPTKELNASPKEATAVCYMAAALVLGMFGDDQGKQRLSDISTNMLQ